MAVTLAKITTKLAIGVGAVYATVSQGVWSTTTESNQAADKIKVHVLPTASEYAEKVCLKMPDEVSNRTIDMWNSGVQWTFGKLADAPSTVASQTRSTASQLGNYVSRLKLN